MELRQYAAYGFLGGVVGAVAVVLCSFVLHYSGIGPRLGADSAVTLASPDIYKPLFWGGLWGIPFGMMMRRLGEGLYLYGFIYFLAPVAALFLIFAPLQGMGFFALNKGASFTLYLVLVNMPFGIVTAAAAKWVSAERRYETRLSAAHQT